MRLRLTRKEKRGLKRFVERTDDKREYRRGTAVLLRGAKRRVKDIARELNVSIDAVERWVRAYRKGGGIDSLRAKKHPGRPPRLRGMAMRRMRELLKEDPRAFGFLKGRWVVRDVAKALSQEGIKVSRSYVHHMLKELGLAYKRPKLDVKSDDPSYYRKAREVKRYKQAAGMLAKGGSWSDSRTRPGHPSTPALKPSG
jgi:transposase